MLGPLQGVGKGLELPPQGGDLLFRPVLIREGQAEGVYRPEYSAEDVTMLLLRGIRAVFFEWCSSGGEVDLTGECLWLLEVAERGFRV